MKFVCLEKVCERRKVKLPLSMPFVKSNNKLILTLSLFFAFPTKFIHGIWFRGLTTHHVPILYCPFLLDLLDGFFISYKTMFVNLVL